jgi:hypothetical protein
LSESLTRATEVLALNPDDPSALLFIAALGPALPAASDAQIKIVTACAVKLLSITLVPHPLAATASDAEPASGSASFVDPDTQRVLAWIRQLRSGRPRVVPTDPEVVKRQVAAAALEWAKNLRR